MEVTGLLDLEVRCGVSCQCGKLGEGCGWFVRSEDEN